MSQQQILSQAHDVGVFPSYLGLSYKFASRTLKCRVLSQGPEMLVAAFCLLNYNKYQSKYDISEMVQRVFGDRRWLTISSIINIGFLFILCLFFRILMLVS